MSLHPSLLEARNEIRKRKGEENVVFHKTQSRTADHEAFKGDLILHGLIKCFSNLIPDILSYLPLYINPNLFKKKFLIS
jgi:hypothetical protein